MDGIVCETGSTGEFLPPRHLNRELRVKELQDLKIHELRIEFVTTVNIQRSNEDCDWIKTSHEIREFAETFERRRDHA